MISAGLLFRIQTVVIFVFLLFIEYDNDCRVKKGSQEPLSYAEVSTGKTRTLKDVIDIQRLFNFILFGIFMTSLMSSILYIKKTMLYLRLRKTAHHNRELSRLEGRYRMAQILQITVMCGSQLTFLSNETQVCSGWRLGYNFIDVVFANIL